LAKDLLTLTLSRLRRLGEAYQGGALPDAELISRFVENGDESAFELLVRRHAAMVLSVCRRILCNEHDAEDAFQATFVVLFRKLRSIHRTESLGAWLHRVAFRVALRAKSRRECRRETDSAVEAVAPAAIGAECSDLRILFDKEIERLPARLRCVAVLCLLEGHSYRTVAEELGCPIGTVQSRLARARAKLQERLVKQGITATAMLGMIAASTSIEAAPLLMQSTLLAAATYPYAASSVTMLARQTLRAMTVHQLGLVAARGLASIAIVGLLGWIGVSILNAANDANVQPVREPDRIHAVIRGSAARTKWKQDLIQIQGDWQLFAGTEDGRAMPPVKIQATVLTFRSDNRVSLGCQRADDRFVLEQATPLPRVELTISHAEGATTQRGVYELNGDSLRICLGPDSSPASDFTCPTGSGRVLWHFRRPGPVQEVDATEQTK